VPAAKTAPRRPTTGSTRAASPRGAERRAAQQRRSWVLFAGAVVLSIGILAAWFPLGSLLSQRQQISAASAQLADLKAQDRALGVEQAKLSSPAEVSKLAREEYQLVQPGQRLVQVLPPAGTSTQLGAGQAPYPGDPGLSPVVRPSAIALLPSGEAPAVTPAHVSHAAHAAAGGGLVDRILRNLEFWRK